MSSNAEFVASIEALLTKAKSYDVEKPDRLARVEMLGLVQELHYRLESPEEAMFRQLTNVCVVNRRENRVELTQNVCSTQKPLQSELYVRWESFKRYHVKEVFQRKNWPLKLGRMKKS
jgi:hypothetical protein